jgi:hypothetical protein
MVNWVGDAAQKPVLPQDLTKKMMDRELSALVGHDKDVSARHYRQAVQVVNRLCHLGMDETDVEVMHLLYTELSKHPRYMGSSVSVKGNPASHSLFSLPIMWEVYQQSGIDRPDLLQLTGLGLLIHDCGEALRELNSLSQRVRETYDYDKEEVEGRILHFVLSEALYAIQEGKPELFDRSMRAAEAAAGITAADRNLRGGHVVGLMTFLDRQQPRELNAAMQEKHRLWYGVWQMVDEAKAMPPEIAPSGVSEADQLFCGKWAKAVEHLQGSRHALRFSRHGLEHADRESLRAELKQPPTSWKEEEQGHQMYGHLDTPLVEGQLYFVERDLPGLMEAARRGDDPQLLTLARQQLSGSYVHLAAAVKKFEAFPSTLISAWEPGMQEARGARTPEMPDVVAQDFQKKLQGMYLKAAEEVLSGGFEPGYVTQAGDQLVVAVEDGAKVKPEVLAMTRPDMLWPQTKAPQMPDSLIHEAAEHLRLCTQGMTCAKS